MRTTAWSYNPSDALPQLRFGLFPGRSPLLGESLLFSLPAGTKMFQFPAFASLLGKDNYPSGNWVVPFGNPRIKDHLHLPAAYRSLSRPSSPPRAKASTGRPNFLSPLAHTFSCKLRVVIKHSVNNLKSLLTVLCVNMSKISSRQTPSVCRA